MALSLGHSHSFYLFAIRPTSLNRHSPDSGSLRSQDRLFERPGQLQIALRVGQEVSKPPVKLCRDVETRCFACIKAHLCRRRLSHTDHAPLMLVWVVPAVGRSATGCRRTFAPTPRPRPSGRSRSDRGSRPSRRSCSAFPLSLDVDVAVWFLWLGKT